MKMGNRRKRREEYLLDVKVQTQGRLNHRLRVAAVVGAATVATTLTCYGAYRLVKASTVRLAYENPRFTIAHIVVENDGAMTPELVMRFAGVRVGQNLMSLDLKQAQRNLAMIPLVRKAELRRLLPDRLFIRVEERIPVARLRMPAKEFGEAIFLIDRSGVVMKPLRLNDGTVVQPRMGEPLPVLTGVSLADVRVGRPVESDQIYLALELLERLEQSVAATLVEIEQVDLSRPRQLVVTTRPHAVVQFDGENMAQQARRLAVILQWARQRNKTVRTVDLTVSRGVPVTFLN
jgi:cell division septal protein FtsQ